MNTKGFTLIELLIYIALFAIISLLIGKQFKTLINNYSSGKQIARQQADSRDIISMLAREVRNTGLKVYLDSIQPDSFARATAPGVAVSAGDQSSFIHKQGNPGDTLTIYKARLSGSGDWLNMVDTIMYYLNGTTLMRNCRTTGGAPTTTTFAENVYAIQFEYGISASDVTLFNQKPLSDPASGWTLTNLTGTSPAKTNGANDVKLTFSGAATGYLKYTTSLSVVENRKYSVRLLINPSDGFPGNLDSLRFSFKKSDNTTVLGSEKFLPRNGNLRITVSVATSESNAYAMLDYYAKGAGTLDIKGVDATCSDLGSYAWTFNPVDNQDKLNVRVMRIYLLTRSSGKAGPKVTTPINVGEVSVLRSGEYTWRLYTQTIEVPNNGMF